MAEIVAGRVALVPQGEWNESKEYKKLDVVRYSDNSYICTKDNANKAPNKIGDNEYWQLMALSKGGGGTQSFPRIDVYFDFFTEAGYNYGRLMKIHNYEYYVENGYKLVVMRRGRYKIADQNRSDEDGEEYWKINRYGYKATVINKETDKIFDNEGFSEQGWKIFFLTVNEDGFVCFEDGTLLEGGNIVHRTYDDSQGVYGISSPRGAVLPTDEQNCASYRYGIAFIDAAKYREWCDKLTEKDCVSNISSFRVFVRGGNGEAYMRK